MLGGFQISKHVHSDTLIHVTSHIPVSRVCNSSKLKHAHAQYRSIKAPRHPLCLCAGSWCVQYLNVLRPVVTSPPCSNLMHRSCRNVNQSDTEVSTGRFKAVKVALAKAPPAEAPTPTVCSAAETAF